MWKKIKYALHCAVHMDYRELTHVVDKVHKASGKNRISIFFDVVSCAIHYGAGFNDYLLCQFYNLSEEQRATYVTRGINNDLVALLNDREKYHLFDNKIDFYRTFEDFLGRRWLDFSKATPSEFAEFVEGLNDIMVKPNSESGGKGVEKIRVGEYPSVDALYQKLKTDDIGVVEEVILQESNVSHMNPDCLNTLRITTILNDEGPHILYAFIRIGNSDRPVDNLHSGGMFAPLDLETGKITCPGYDKEQRTFTVHPKTKTEIIGFQIPFWEEAKSLCLKAATRIPEMRYIGWDIGITENGPVMVEGNNLPGYDILQMPPHTPDKIGMLPKYRELLKNEYPR